MPTKRKPKRPLGPRKALEAMALRMAANVMARQRKRIGAAEPSVHVVEFDDITGWADVPKHTAPSQEARRGCGAKRGD
jgi:hypothetical protein